MKEQIQDKLEKIDGHVRWLSERLDRYFHALGEIASCGDQANSVYLRGVARAALDGEPTTADEYNNKEMLEDMDNYPSNYNINVPVVGKDVTTPDNVKWVSPHDPGDENDSSENRYHDTNAQIIAYDKSMEEE
tara:strand:- start:1441 stop:1839 length:399 start_codon:yes stop_codon:yes gene_type:complete